MSEQKTKFASDTSGRSIKDWAVALIVLLIGLTVAHLGVTLFLLSALGTDTFTVFIQGLSVVFGLTVGTVHVIVLCILMVVMLLTTKGYVKPGTVVCAFCGGPIIGFKSTFSETFALQNIDKKHQVRIKYHCFIIKLATYLNSKKIQNIIFDIASISFNPVFIMIKTI